MSLATFFEVDKTKLVNGQARVLFSQLGNGALTDQPVPTAGIQAIYAMESPYAPFTASGASPWVDFGGTQAPPEDSRNLTINEWKVQQQYTALLMVPGEIDHTIKIPAIEVARPDILGLFENGPAQTAIVAGSHFSAQALQPFGQFTDLLQYRIAIASFMPLLAGTVTEPSGTRPRMFVKFFNRCSITAENVPLQWAIGEPLHCDVTLKCYIEPGQNQNAEYGGYLVEAAGTLT
ncbi:MAG TPA: hypothetical protein VFG23_12850 [Polyangia bacterium]|nr:hypothetical protein [Polyangia bacterium]